MIREFGRDRYSLMKDAYCRLISRFPLGFLPRMLLPVTVGWLLSACTHTQEQIPPVPQPVAELTAKLPAQYAASEAIGSYEPLEWWRAFNDPVLDQLIEAVLTSNFGLAEAVARVDQARARERIIKSVTTPLLQPTLGVSEFDSPTNAGIGAQLDQLGLGSGLLESFNFALPDRLGLTNYNLGLEFAYEVDFWGRNRNNVLAAAAEVMASQADYLSARIGALAETVGAYLEWANLRHQLRLTEEIVNLLRQQESLAEFQYERGLIDLRDLHAVRQSHRQSQAELPRIEGLIAEVEGQLWILTGGYRADLADALSQAPLLSITTNPVPAGIPADLLVQRPDVLAAMQRVEAARYRVGARRSERYPRLSLQGSIGLQSTDSSDWFDPDQWFRNLSMNLLGPIFQGSLIHSNIALAEANLQEAAMAYGRSVVTAVNEVEAALVGLEANIRRHSLLVSLRDEAEAESKLHERRYVTGVGAYEVFLRARQIQIDREALLVAATRDLGYARLAVHRALGGAWASTGGEVPHRPTPVTLLSIRSPIE